MAHYSPELIARFIGDREQRREWIACCEGLDHPFLQKCNEIASCNLEWVEHNATTKPLDDYPEWVISYAETQQKIEAINWQIGIMRAIENAAGKDNSQSNRLLQMMFFSSFPDYNHIWRKTQLKAYWKSREAFEAVYSVWTAEWGVKDKKISASENVSVVPEEMRAKRVSTDGCSRSPAGLLDIYAYVAAQKHQSGFTVRRLIDHFCKIAPLLLLLNLETGRVQRDPIIAHWLIFMQLGKT